MGEGFDGKLKPSLASQLNNLKNQGRLERDRVSVALQRRGTDETGAANTGGKTPGASDDKDAKGDAAQSDVSPFQSTSSRETLRAMLHRGSQSEDSVGRRGQSTTSFEMASPDIARKDKDAKSEQQRPLYNSLQVDTANLLVTVRFFFLFLFHVFVALVARSARSVSHCSLAPVQIRVASRMLQQLSRGQRPQGHDDHLRHSLPVAAMSDYHRSQRSVRSGGGSEGAWVVAKGRASRKGG